MEFVRRIEDATDLLESIVENRARLAELEPELRRRFLTAAGRASKPDNLARRQLNREHRRREKIDRREHDRALLHRSEIRKLRSNPIFETPRRQGVLPPAPISIGSVHEARVCYVCHNRYTAIHWFYDQMCLSCGDFNHKKRSQSADLSGRVALITGARVKIGYQAAIMLLRAGAEVLVVTRFPVDAARRYAAEDDFDQWSHRLKLYGVDLRHTPSVEALCAKVLAENDRLDFLINNACQTVRRPPAFYQHLMDRELSDGLDPAGQALIAWQGSDPRTLSAALSQVPLLPDDHLDPSALFPANRLDADLQQVDLRSVNSWRLRMDCVPTVELLEVHLVNAIAPFVLNARLKPLMSAVSSCDKHIVNVSAVEGQFYRTLKSDKHPHTNMAKAALNMMTRTSAIDYIESGIHMNSVDTGWVSDEDPIDHAERKRELHDFSPPVDIVDGAARIVDPIFSGLNSGQHIWGQFLKNYAVTDW